MCQSALAIFYRFCAKSLSYLISLKILFFILLTFNFVLQTSDEYVSLKQQLQNAAYLIPNKTHPHAVCIHRFCISV